MGKFWQFFAMLLRYKRLLSVALVAALVDAACKAGGAGALPLIVSLFFYDYGTRVAALKETLYTLKFMGLDVTPVLGYIPTDPWRALAATLGGVLALAVIGSAARFVHESITYTVSLRTVMRIRKAIFTRLVHMPMEFAGRQRTAEQASRIFRDTSMLAQGFTALTGKTVSGVFGGLACFAVAFVQNWRLTLTFIVVVPPIAILIRKFGKRIRKASKKALKQSGTMLGAVNEALQGLRVVKVHHTEGYERRRFNKINRMMFKQQMKVRTVRAMSSPIIETMSLCGLVGVILLASWMVFHPSGKDPVTADEMVGVIGALILAGASFRTVSGLNNSLNEAAAAAENIDETLHWPVESAPRSSAQRKLIRLPGHQKSVAFEGVTYTYPGRETPALRSISFTVPHGSTCAVVGGNGSGKSTLLGLLPRLYDPAAGRILIDGVDIASCSLRSLRKQIAMVTQETVLFDATVMENITYGSRHVTEARMIDAAKRAHAHGFIEQLPQGYATQVGERGQRLSGGQRQRIAIARAILRDPQILILDEATSQIDADSESHITAALAEFAAGRTTFVIAHRLSTVVHADMIVVMSAGSVAAIGQHDDLLRTSEDYRTLCRTQLHGAEQPVG